MTDSASGSPHALPLNGTGLDFTVTANPSTLTVTAGSNANTSVKIAAAGGAFNPSVSLSCSGLPTSTTCSFSPSAVIPGNASATSTLTLQTTRRHGNVGTPAGTYTITVTATSGSLTHKTSLTLTVN